MLIVTGMVAASASAGIFFLSRCFVYGEAYLERPILEFLLVEAIAYLFYFITVIRYGRKASRSQRASQGRLFWILAVAILCRLLLMPSHLILENDPYRYIWDGQILNHGVNPYAFPPDQAFAVEGILDSEPAAYTVERVGYRFIRSIYPPMAQWLFSWAQRLSPWSLAGWRLMILGAEILLMILILKFLARLGKPPEWLVVYAWSPLVLKEFANSAHLDVFAVLFLMVSLWAVVNRSWVAAALFLALSILTKIFAVFLLPLLAVWIGRKDLRTALRMGIVMAAVCVFLLFPFRNAGVRMWEGLACFAMRWQVNDGVFSVLDFCAGLIGAARGGFLTRAISGLLMVVAAAGSVIWLRPREDEASLLRACLFVLAAVFFLAPTGNPWYFTWTMPLLAIFPARPLLLFSGLVFLYYLDFYFSYRSAGHLMGVVRFFEYGLFFAYAGVRLWRSRRLSALSSRS